MRYLDDYLQQLVERLQRSGVYDRSIIAVTADHGEEFHEHDGWWHGTTLYEEQVHVPLIIKRAAASRRRAGAAPTWRVPSTSRRRWSRSAGVPVPDTRQGIDLFDGSVNEPILAEEDLEGNRLTSIRSGDWKLITANRDNPRGLAPVELYNLGDDPRRAHQPGRRRGRSRQRDAGAARRVPRPHRQRSREPRRNDHEPCC